MDVYFILLLFIRNARRGGPAANISLIFVETHGKTSNRPTVNEIAAAVTDEDAPAGRHLRVYTRLDNGLQPVSNLSPHVDPMTYPLLFPYGEPGYSLNYRPIFSFIKSNKPGKLIMKSRDESSRPTMRQYYSARIAIRKHFSLLHSSARIFQTYVVDMAVKILIFSLICQTSLTNMPTNLDNTNTYLLARK